MVAGLAPLRPPLHLSVTRAAVVVESKWWFDRTEPSRSCIQDTHPFYGSEGAIAGRGASVPRFPQQSTERFFASDLIWVQPRRHGASNHEHREHVCVRRQPPSPLRALDNTQSLEGRNLGASGQL
jgi:hypothetical protein